MTHNPKSKFSWSFTGYADEPEAKKNLESMEAWFRATFNDSEWQVNTSVYNTPYGFGASLVAERHVDG